MKATGILLSGLLAVGVTIGAVAQVAPEASGSKKPRSHKTVAPEAVRPKTAGQSQFPVVCFLERRGQIITIKAAPDGPVYSAVTKDGKVLFTDLTEKQLRAKAPDLHQFIKTGVAKGGTAQGGFLDASVQLSSNGRSREVGVPFRQGSR